jgi:transposase
MTTPGVGPVVALTYRATVDVPARFRKSKAVGAVFGLTCAKYQSGEVDRNGSFNWLQHRCGHRFLFPPMNVSTNENTINSSRVCARGSLRQFLSRCYVWQLANICRVLSCMVSSPAQHVAWSETTHLLH